MDIMKKYERIRETKVASIPIKKKKMGNWSNEKKMLKEKC